MESEETKKNSGDAAVWVSLDPVRCRVDVYPRSFAQRIEDGYAKASDEVYLGADFFDATVRMRRAGASVEVVQTTRPIAFSACRFGSKAPGFRTVRRLPLYQQPVALHACREHGEWRFCDPDRAERTVEAPVSVANAVVAHAGDDASPPRTWAQGDLAQGAAEASLIVWQWCQSGALTAAEADESSWCPYPADVNVEIERAYKNGDEKACFSLGQRRMEVSTGAVFGMQRDRDRYRARLARRVVIGAEELRSLMGEAERNFAADSASFLCPITHQPFRQPVLTADGHTYEKDAIETWLRDNYTSPVTGLPLKTHNLVPNVRLLEIMKARPL